MGLNIHLAVDCRDPHQLAEWWADTLGWVVDYPNPEAVRTLVEQGRAGSADVEIYNDRVVWRTGAAIFPPQEVAAGVQPGRVLFQRVPEVKTSKNRIHWDVDVAGRDKDIVRDELAARGATFLYTAAEGTHSWHTMADPEGNEFCIY